MFVFCSDLKRNFVNRKSMKVKILLKFYFNAEALNKRLDGLITYHACRAADNSFEKVAALIEDKSKLCNLMYYLQGRFVKLTERDLAALKSYADLRVGIRNLEDGERRNIKRAVMKFTRKLTYIGRYEEEVLVLKKYKSVL